ncbi:MAG: NAD(P)/FAD-dependent oxidoreductase [Candidatus Thorarchaeota archaeon]|nr:NAD(P)/FAD-dependent oxidoreductase [Candidatus Thorarchaeota archaeon]
MYDVVVIGAGPGGATVSRSMAKLGLDVCMIDKDTFPRDKPCGGGFSRTIIDEFAYLKPRAPDFMKGVAKVGVIHSPNRQVVLEGKVDMAVTLRADFDNVLFEEAVSAGSLPLNGRRAKKVIIHDDCVTIDLAGGKSVQGKVVIGADGVTSMVARETQLNKRWPSSSISACRVCEVPASTQDILDRYTDDLKYHFFANLGGQPGYGWIFPKEDTINVGLGIVGTHAQGLPSKFDAFVRFLKMKDLLPQTSDLSGAEGALVPTAGPIKQTVADRCILLGDSAGHVSPLTGGGIAYAMKAARFAAHVVASALENNSLDAVTLSKYQHLWQSHFGDEFRNQLLAQKIFTSPFTDLLFHIGSKDEKIQEIVSESMAESSDGDLDVKQLALRTLKVCLREALRL